MIAILRDITKFNPELTDCPIIGEIECEKINIFDVLKIGIKHYVVSRIDMVNGNRQQIGVKKISLARSPEDKEYEHYITCPYCGYENIDSFECPDSDDQYECGRCGAIMKMEREVEISYSTQPVTPPNIVPAKFLKGV